MRIVVDTNIAFSAILNTDSRIARILLQPRSRLNFYSTEQLLSEINEHRGKIKKISRYSEEELSQAIQLITGKIRFIDVNIISREAFKKAELLTRDVDVDDTEFVALTEHAKARLWSGDKELIVGLSDRKWTKWITTDELYKLTLPQH